MYLFQKKKISKDQDAFVHSAIEDFKTQSSKYQIPKLSFLQDFDVTKHYYNSSHILYIRELFHKLGYQISHLQEQQSEHSSQQRKNHSSFYSKKDEHENQVTEELCAFANNYIQSMVKQINNSYKIASDELKIFTFYQTQISNLLLELQSINKETHYTPEHEDIIGIITNAIEALGQCIDYAKKLPSELMYKNTKNNYDEIYSEISKLKNEAQCILEITLKIYELFYAAFQQLSRIPINTEKYIQSITTLWISDFMNSLTNEKNMHHLADKPTIVRYSQMHLNSLYSRFDSKFRDAIDSFSKTNISASLNSQSQRAFAEIYNNFNAKKTEIVKYRDEQINIIHGSKARNYFRTMLEKKILKDYDLGNYQGVLRTIIELNNKESLYLDDEVISAKQFRLGNEYLFHGISPFEIGQNGSWNSGTNRPVAPQIYAQRIINVITNGIKASNRNDSPFEGKLCDCQETYYFATYNIPTNDSGMWHYGFAGVMFDARNKFAVHKIRRHSSGFNEYVILTNPRHPIVADFTLVLNIKRSENSVIVSPQYMATVIQLLKDAGIKYITV